MITSLLPPDIIHVFLAKLNLLIRGIIRAELNGEADQACGNPSITLKCTKTASRQFRRSFEILR
jgi:hypothetical protein